MQDDCSDRDERKRYAIKQLRAALDGLESSIDSDTPEPLNPREHWRIVGDGTFEALYLVDDGMGKPFHYFMARHNGGAFPRARPENDDKPIKLTSHNLPKEWVNTLKWFESASPDEQRAFISALNHNA